MGETKFKLSDIWTDLLREYFCWMLGHSFKYEPMEGDKPPFECTSCMHCGASNPTFKEPSK